MAASGTFAAGNREGEERKREVEALTRKCKEGVRRQGLGEERREKADDDDD